MFCDELIRQELDNDTREIPIPQEILIPTKMYRSLPLVRAYCLRKSPGTPAKIHYKFEGNKHFLAPHKRTAIAQAYYAAKNQGPRASPLRPAPASGARPCPWPAHTWGWTARSTW